MTYTEEELIFSIKENCQSAFKYLYANYYIGLWCTIRKIITDEHVAEELLQDTFVKIWSNIGQYDAQKGRFYTWMICIAKNKAIDHLRSKSNTISCKTSCKEQIDEHEVVTIPNVHQIGLSKLVNELSPRYGAVIKNVYYKGNTLIETAQAMELPLGTIKTRIHVALKTLRRDFAMTATAG